jgi:hypothetical protein
MRTRSNNIGAALGCRRFRLHRLFCYVGKILSDGTPKSRNGEEEEIPPPLFRTTSINSKFHQVIFLIVHSQFDLGPPSSRLIPSYGSVCRFCRSFQDRSCRQIYPLSENFVLVYRRVYAGPVLMYVIHMFSMELLGPRCFGANVTRR